MLLTLSSDVNDIRFRPGRHLLKTKASKEQRDIPVQLLWRLVCLEAFVFNSSNHLHPYFIFGTTSLSASITSLSVTPWRITMKMVSSPAIVPMICGMSLLSML